MALPPAADLSRRGAGALMMVPQAPLVVNSAAQSREAAVKVWTFLQSKEFLGMLYQQALALPVTDGIMDKPGASRGLRHF